jgi:hypothetical protein
MLQPRTACRLLLCLVLTALPAAVRSDAQSAGQSPTPAATAPATDLGDQLRRAASAGDVARVRELLAAGADVNAANAYGGTARAFASKKGPLEVVKLLLEKGANIEAKDTFYGSTPLQWAATKGHPEIARELLAKGAQGEAELLAQAAAGGDAALVKVVLDRGKVAPTALSEALAAAEAAPEGRGKEVATLLRGAGVQPPPPVEIDPAVLRSYEGAYETEGATFRLTLKVQDGKLVGEGGGGPPLTLAPVDATHFRGVEFPLKVTFDVQEGMVRGFSFEGGGRTTVLHKVDQGGTKP